MKKRLLLYVIFMLAVFYGVYSVFQAYKPKNIDIIDTEVITYEFPNRTSVKDFEEKLTSNGKELKVIFYDKTQINSQYFFNNIWPSLIADNPGIMADRLLYIDISENQEAAIALSKLGYKTLPALETLKYENGAITVVSILQDHGSTTLNAESMLAWLKENDLILKNEDTTNDNNKKTGK